MNTEKKEFLIPENVESGVKLLGEVKIKELIKTLAPSALISAAILYSPISNPFIKLGVVATLFIIPGFLILYRPVRRNIPVSYMMKAWFSFMLRQRFLPYQKERYHVEATEETDKGRKAKADSTKSHSIKGSSWRAANNSR